MIVALIRICFRESSDAKNHDLFNGSFFLWRELENVVTAVGTLRAERDRNLNEGTIYLGPSPLPGGYAIPPSWHC
jgi:hypothetical protein